MAGYTTDVDDRSPVDQSSADRTCAAAAIEELAHASDVVFADGEPFRFRVRSLRDLHVVFTTSAGSTARRAVMHPGSSVVLGWATDGDLDVTQGDCHDIVPAGVPVALSTCAPSTVSAPAGVLRSVRIDLAFLETVDAVLRGRTPASRSGAPALRALPLGSALPRLRTALAAAARASSEPTEPVSSRLSLQVELAEQVLLAYGTQSDDVRGIAPVAHKRSAVRTVEAARTWMAGHCDGPVTLADVCDAVGLSARTLQSAFLEQTRTTPMAYLLDMRLDRVRIALQLADPRSDSVGNAARQWGFRHMGRFAGSYAERFGEYPAETLRGVHTRRRASTSDRRTA